MVGARKADGERPFGRIGGALGVVGARCARRNGEGERAAKISRGNESVGGFEGAAIGLYALCHECAQRRQPSASGVVKLPGSV